jgi:hypothetical protein
MLIGWARRLEEQCNLIVSTYFLKGQVNNAKLYTPPPFLVDSWSIPSIPVHSQEFLESPGSFPEQGGVGMGGKKGGGRVYEAEEGGMECEGGVRR